MEKPNRCFFCKHLLDARGYDLVYYRGKQRVICPVCQD